VAVRKLHISGVVTTFITGTITTAIVSLVEKHNSETSERRREHSSPLLLAMMFLTYVVAAALSAWLRAIQRDLAVLFPIGLLAVVMLRAVVRSKSKI
jgi:uncharacterized membrane protein YoaK (UPF0700 family)